ncbi:MAG: hypothetical protein KY453_04380 [Gemmatimonadetes bacterium]|nr:hypothetical protein [Gemmatimonadota bacterium]
MFRFLRCSLIHRLLLLAALAAFLRVGALHAQDCYAVDQWDAPRQCTLTESFGHCLNNVLVSYNQCLAGDVWDTICGGAAAFDLVGCAAGLAWWSFIRM